MADAAQHRLAARLAGTLLVGLVSLAGCGTSSSAGEAAVAVPSPTAFPTDDVVPSPSPTPSPSPSASPSPFASPSVTPTPGVEDPDAPPSATIPDWHLTILAVDDELRSRMEPTSWREGCPVGLEELRLLRFPHMTFDGEVLEGELVISAEWAEAVGSVFADLFAAGYPVERIELVDSFDGDDQRSMVANNTSGFNCREVAYSPGVWSNHASGTAIDVNPLYNPYVSGDFVDPAVAAAFVDRSVIQPGMVADGDPAVVAFERIGWTWGGRWGDVKDYQHFSANGR